MAKSQIEASIRDKLSENLDFIEKNLVLIKDEYHLKNPNGASGFVDIFAQDSNNNYVVIELKRSDASSREAITELSKYVALLRRTKNVNNSEIRLIVISTEWHELLVPFSEFFHATSYQLEGYHLTVDEKLNPKDITRIIPLPQVKGRNICRRHFIRYYKNETDLANAVESFVKQARNIGVNDFILAKFDLTIDDPIYGITKVLYSAQQLKNRDFYIDQLTKRLNKEGLDEIIDYIEDMDEDDSLDELADGLMDEIRVDCETCEIGHPEKLIQRLNDNLWSLQEISKYGVFNEDNRLTDQLLLTDLKGLTGNSHTNFFTSYKTENRSKFDELKESVDYCLFHNDTWRHNIKDIFDYSQKKNNATITISIFNKDDLLETIWGSSTEDPELWMPSFYVVIDPSNDEPVEIFKGRLVWEETEIDVEQTVSEVFEGFKNYLINRHFGSQRNYDQQLMVKMGFKYQIDYIKLDIDSQENKKNIKIKGNQISEIHNSKEYMSFEDFINSNHEIVQQIAENFDDRHIGGGIFTY